MKGNFKMTDEQTNKNLYDEPSLEDFLMVEELDERDIRKKRRKAKWIKVGIVFLALGLLANVLVVWVNVVNLPAVEFVKTSLRLSQMESIKEAKHAVVTIQGDSLKGTGFNIREDGLIITNSHVIENMNPITVYFPNGKVFRGKILKDSPELDIAILEIDGENLPVLNIEEEPLWNVQDHIYVIGNPLSFTQIANEGNIEGLIYTDDKKKTVIKISAPVYRGNSGSPVLNDKNGVVGVVFATTVPKLSSNEKASGLVVPIDQVIELLEVPLDKR
jgi:serine protease Do